MSRSSPYQPSVARVVETNFGQVTPKKVFIVLVKGGSETMLTLGNLGTSCCLAVSLGVSGDSFVRGSFKLLSTPVLSQGSWESLCLFKMLCKSRSKLSPKSYLPPDYHPHPFYTEMKRTPLKQRLRGVSFVSSPRLQPCTPQRRSSWGTGSTGLISGHDVTTFCSRLAFFCHAACGILVPWPGIEPGFPAMEAQSPNYWTVREFLCSELLLSQGCHNREEIIPLQEN